MGALHVGVRGLEGMQGEEGIEGFRGEWRYRHQNHGGKPNKGVDERVTDALDRLS